MTKRRFFICPSLLLLTVLVLTSCGLPENKLPLFQRSLHLDSQEEVEEVLARASLEMSEVSGAAPFRVVTLRGTPYEMGFQQGRLLQQDIQALYRQVLKRVRFYMHEQMLDEVYDLMAPYIPLEEQEEMRGLAHGAEVPLRVVHWVHAVPEISEYGEKKTFRRGFSATSCSNVAAFGEATADGELYQLRVLDWIRDFGVQQWPVILLHRPDRGHASITVSFAGFIGAVSGMNDQGLVLGEMGYGDPPAETLEGIPFAFLFRRMLREASTLEDARRMITEAPRTNSYVYVVSDVKARTEAEKARIFITDRDRVLSYAENTHLIDEREDGDVYRPVDDVVYGGAKGDLLYEELQRQHGKIAPDVLMEISRTVSLKSNLQNVIFKPSTFELWVSNAGLEEGRAGKAAEQEWLHFEFADVISP